MSKKKNVHVVPAKGKEAGWATKKEGASRAGSRHSTQGQAIERARKQAKREGTEVVIHRLDGRIRDKDSYGNDPNPPKDTKH